MKDKYRIKREYDPKRGMSFYNLEIRKKAGFFRWPSFWGFETLFRTEDECHKHIEYLESPQFSARLQEAKDVAKYVGIIETHKYKY